MDAWHDISHEQARVVGRLDNAIHHGINHYPADSMVCFVKLIYWIAIFLAFEQLGSGFSMHYDHIFSPCHCF